MNDRADLFAEIFLLDYFFWEGRNTIAYITFRRMTVCQLQSPGVVIIHSHIYLWFSIENHSFK
jgi:hypothetical protein